MSACIAAAVSGGPALGATRRDIEVAVRALEFLVPPLRDHASMAVLYSPKVPGSQVAADRVVHDLAGDIRTATTTVTARAVAVEDLAAAQGIALFFVPDGLDALFDIILRESVRLRVPSVATDLACVTAARCLMAVRTTPRVEITVSGAVAEKAGVGFRTPFRLMVMVR